MNVLQHKVSGSVCSCGFLAGTLTRQCWPEIARDLIIPWEVGVPCGDGVPWPAATWPGALWAAQPPRGARASMPALEASSLECLSLRLWGLGPPGWAGCRSLLNSFLGVKPFLKEWYLLKPALTQKSTITQQFSSASHR